jgi:hypothetical protein
MSAVDPALLAERTAAFLLERVARRWRHFRDQGALAVPLEPPPGCGPALKAFARRRVRGVPEPVARGLLAWAAGQRPVDLLDQVPTARQVLALQAAGRRCVSLLDDEVALAHGDPRHPDGLSFALHDLCHLEKFVAPEHHSGQVGFFRSVARAFDTPAFTDLERHFDPTWRADRDYVIADMNGSAIFLFAALKMKLNVAIRRQLAANNGRPAPASGPLDDKERAALGPALLTLIEAMGLDQPAVREAALLITTRRAHPQAARRLLTHFELTAQPAQPYRPPSPQRVFALSRASGRGSG